MKVGGTYEKLVYLLISTGLAFIICFSIIPINAIENKSNPDTGITIEVAIPELQEGESITLDSIPIYVSNDFERSSTRIINITPTFNKISSSRYTVTLTLRLLDTSYYYYNASFNLLVQGNILQGYPTKLNQRLIVNSSVGHKTEYVTSSSFAGEQGNTVRLVINNVLLNTYYHGTMSGEGSSGGFFLN